MMDVSSVCLLYITMCSWHHSHDEQSLLFSARPQPLEKNSPTSSSYLQHTGLGIDVPVPRAVRFVLGDVDELNHDGLPHIAVAAIATPNAELIHGRGGRSLGPLEPRAVSLAGLARDGDLILSR